MKILVIDDNPIHQTSAHQTLSEHELTVVSSYDEALGLMGQHFMPSRLPSQARQKQTFDVVLADLMMPASMGGLGGEGGKYIGQEMPMGFPLALIAVLYSGAKYIAVVTDTNRHAHPASHALDLLAWRDNFRGEAPHKPLFTMNDAVVGFYNSGHRDLKVSVAGYDQPGKNWGAVLAYLTGQVVSEGG